METIKGFFRFILVFFFWIAGLASAFSVLASIIHFQIIGAVAFFFASWVCWAIAFNLQD